jgi:hypothetical protein
LNVKRSKVCPPVDTDRCFKNDEADRRARASLTDVRCYPHTQAFNEGDGMRRKLPMKDEARTFAYATQAA